MLAPGTNPLIKFKLPSIKTEAQNLNIQISLVRKSVKLDLLKIFHIDNIDSKNYFIRNYIVSYDIRQRIIMYLRFNLSEAPYFLTIVNY